MKKNKTLLLSLLTVSLSLIGFKSPLALSQTDIIGTPTPNILKQGKAYYCDEENYEHPNLVFRSDLGNVRLIEFQTNFFAKKEPSAEPGKTNWTPLERCRELARRGEHFENLGIISYLTVETMPDGLNAICISRVLGDHLELLKDPDGEQMVRLYITLTPDDNPEEILNKIKGISSISSKDPLIH